MRRFQRFVALIMQYVIGPSGALTSGSSTGANSRTYCSISG